MNTEQIMALADAYAQACVELECENDEHGTVSGSSVDAMTEARAALEAALTEKQGDAIIRAWQAGYYEAGYTHDQAYADKMAQEYLEATKK